MSARSAHVRRVRARIKTRIPRSGSDSDTDSTSRCHATARLPRQHARVASLGHELVRIMLLIGCSHATVTLIERRDELERRVQSLSGGRESSRSMNAGAALERAARAHACVASSDCMASARSVVWRKYEQARAHDDAWNQGSAAAAADATKPGRVSGARRALNYSAYDGLMQLGSNAFSAPLPPPKSERPRFAPPRRTPAGT